MDILTFRSMGSSLDGSEKLETSETSELTDSFIKKVNDIPDDVKEHDALNFAKTYMNGKLWKQLANFYLSKIREIQYKLTYQPYTEWETNATWTNYTYFKGHDIWMVHLIRSHIKERDKLKTIVNHCFGTNTNTDNENNSVYIKDKDECWDRMCTRLCQPKLSWESALLLLDSVDKDNGTKENPDKIRNTITKNMMSSFGECDDSLFEDFLPYLIDRMVNADRNEILINFVISRCSSSKRISNHVYRALTIERDTSSGIPGKIKTCEYLISRLFRDIPKDIYNVLIEVNNFVHSIEDNFVGNETPETPIKNIDKIKTCISPTHPERGTQTVSPEVFPGEKSANKPVPIKLSTNNSENIILYKREDLRTDLVIMSIIRIMKRILEDTMGIDLHIITYNVQPTSPNSGFISAVKDCETLYKIEEKLNLTLSNFAKKHNPDISSKELSERFIRSCAFYTVVTFLLGIGDRHLDNIMMNKDGKMFHIDYSFVLGKDPKFITPSMRLSEGMIDAIGGAKSESYEEFGKLCVQIYSILRRHVNTFVCMLSLLPRQNTGESWTNPKISNRRLLREIVKRFAPGETSQEAKVLLHTRIDKSTNVTSRSRNYVLDWIHRHNKEQTLSNVLSYTFNSTLSGTKSLMQGIFAYITK